MSEILRSLVNLDCQTKSQEDATCVSLKWLLKVKAEAERATPATTLLGEAQALLKRFCDGPPGKGFRTDGWTTDEHRYCGYCTAKSAWGDTPLVHYSDCVFVAARAFLRAAEGAS